MHRHASPAARLLRSVPVSRRRFLALSAASVAGAATLGPHRLAAADSPLELLSVGYVEDSDGLGSLRRPPWPLMRRTGPSDSGPAGTSWTEVESPYSLGVVPADGLLMGDPELSLGTAWMRIHGLHPAFDSSTARLFRSVHLHVLFPSDDPANGEFEIAAPWGARGGPHPAEGLPVRFRVPLRVDGGLELYLDVERKDGSPRQLATAFTVDPVGGLPKLQRGIYLLGLEPGAWSRKRGLGGGDRSGEEELSVVVSFESAE